MVRRITFACVFIIFLFTYVTANAKINFTIQHLWNSPTITDHKPIELSLSSTADQNNVIIEINAPFFRDPAPSTMPPGPFSELWNYEVVELFFLASSTNHYLELEFSPHGHYLVLLLTDRRKLLKQMLPITDYYIDHRASNFWFGRALVPCALFPGRIDRFNAYAIHGQDSNRTYEALYPAPPESAKPDFHRLELFQPLKFELLLNKNEKDGESWNNAGLKSISSSFSILNILVLVSFIFKNS